MAGARFAPEVPPPRPDLSARVEPHASQRVSFALDNHKRIAARDSHREHRAFLLAVGFTLCVIRKQDAPVFAADSFQRHRLQIQAAGGPEGVDDRAHRLQRQSVPVGRILTGKPAHTVR